MAGMALALALTGTAAAHGGHGKRTDCPKESGELRCAEAATPAFAPDGGLWLAWAAGGRVWAARSADNGRSFAAPVDLSGKPGRVDAEGDARPVIVLDGQGSPVVAWTVRRDPQHGVAVLVARGGPDGTFTPAAPLATGNASEVALTRTNDGRLAAAWIEVRKEGEGRFSGSLKAAWSQAGGFGPALTVGGRSCECCRVALAPDGDDAAIAWRAVFEDGARDHALARLDKHGATAPRRIADDGWKIDACPHHGPSLALSGGTRHVVWFTDGARRQGLFYARAEGEGAFGAPMPLGAPDRQAGHGQVLALGDSVWLAWKEFDGERTRIFGRRSSDGGRSFAPPAELASSGDASDHPILVSDGKRAYLSWLTRAEGYRLLPLDGGPS